jgi:hypothetical protein
MTKHTPAVAAPERDWVAEVAAIWHDLARGGRVPEGQEVAAARGRAFADHDDDGQWTAGGVSKFGHLREDGAGRRRLGPGRGALECAAPRPAAVRPVLEARLQQRLDTADEQMPEVKCPGCGQAGSLARTTSAHLAAARWVSCI